MQVVTLLLLPTEKTPEQRQGRIIRLARETQELTQKQLGDRVGLSQKAISNIERGQGTSSVMIFRIARALKQRPDVFEV
jgi:transcriptional regulator with XRE-family HTH domain